MRGLSACLISVVALGAAGAGCSHEPDHFARRAVPILHVWAVGSYATSRQLNVGLDNCKADNPGPYTVSTQETPTSIRIQVVGPVWTGENQAACMDGLAVTLTAPLAARSVIDGATGHTVTVQPAEPERMGILR